jgi:hypothetical protein
LEGLQQEQLDPYGAVGQEHFPFFHTESHYHIVGLLIFVALQIFQGSNLGLRILVQSMHFFHGERLGGMLNRKQCRSENQGCQSNSVLHEFAPPV